MAHNATIEAQAPPPATGQPLTPNFDGIPAELRELRRWVLWKLDKSRTGKPTKVPYQANGRKAASTRGEDWTDFATAKAAYERGGFAGIGFVFNGDGLVGVDLDHCRDAATGVVEPAKQAIIDRLNTYSELSVSGTGVHLLTRGTVPPGGNRKGPVEIYSTARYFTMSGRPVNGQALPIADRQAELDALHAEIFGKAAKALALARAGDVDGQAAPAGKAVAEIGSLRLDPNAEPPGVKFAALLVNDRTFKKTWEKKRTDFQDKSPSAYDMGLANACVQSGWSDQEICNTLIARRREHKDDLKLRLDYYRRTIGKARALHEGEAAIARHMDEAPQPGSAADVPLAPDKRKELLADISKALGVEIGQWIQHGRTKARFSMVLANGRDISVGSVAALFNQALFRQRLYEETGIVLKSFKQDNWHKKCQALFMAATIVENAGLERGNRIEEWLEQYTSRTPVYPDWDHHKALHSSEPFIKGDKLYVHANSLLGFVRQQLFEKLDKEDMLDDLRAYGFQIKQETARTPGSKRVIARQYWFGPAAGIKALTELIKAKPPTPRDESEEGLDTELPNEADDIPI